VIITAYPAGHSLGGAIWKIQKGSDVIVVALGYNHKRERILNGTVLHLGFDRPSLLITDATNMNHNPPSRKINDNLLFQSTYDTLSNGGSVLIPIDATTRILELCYLLDQHWAFHRLPFPIYLISTQGRKVFNIANTMLEWMGDAITHLFTQNREVPFAFKKLKVLTRWSDYEKLPKDIPRLVLATPLDMDVGFSNALLHEFAGKPENLILLPERGFSSQGVTRWLYDYWNEHSPKTSEIRAAVQMEVSYETEYRRRILLEGDELQDYLQSNPSEPLHPNDPGYSDSDASDDDDEAIGHHHNPLHTQFDIYVKNQMKTSSFFKQSQSFFMFPVQDFRRKVDEYGEIIDPDEYRKGEYQHSLDQKVEDEAMISMRIEEEKEMEEEEDPLFNDLVPYKYECASVTLEMNCKLLYIDFEGLSDGKSIKNIISQVAPKKLILIPTESLQDTTQLYVQCVESDVITNEVYAPATGETVNVSSARFIYQVKLTDALVSHIMRFGKFGEYEIGFVDGMIRVDVDVEDKKRKAPEEEGEKKKQKSIALDAPRERSFNAPRVVGNVKLSDIKTLLNQHGYEGSYLTGGVLGIPKYGILLRKVEKGHLSMEGRPSKVYYEIRELLYQCHALV
jgi:cleavage and polyadenylation specificity factor subunit 2